MVVVETPIDQVADLVEVVAEEFHSVLGCRAVTAEGGAHLVLGCLVGK